MFNKIILGTAGLIKGYSSTSLTPLVFDLLLDSTLDYGIKYVDTAFAYDEDHVILKSPKCNISCINTKIEIKNLNLDQTKNLLDKFFKDYGAPLNTLYVHDFTVDTVDSFGEIIGYLLSLKSKGLINKIGVSLYTVEELNLLMDGTNPYISLIDVIQIPYNIFDRRFESFFQTLKNLGVEIHARSVFLRGALFNSKLSPLGVRDKIDLFTLEQDSDKLSLIYHSINFINRNSNIDYMILGLNSMEEWMDVLESYSRNQTHIDYDKFMVNDFDAVNIKNW